MTERPAVALVLLSGASFLAVVDTTIVSIALPSMTTSLELSDAVAPWVLTAYALGFGALLLPLGRAADRVGRRRMFCAGLLVFAVASSVAGLSPNAATLVLSRFVQGVASAAYVPASLALLTVLYAEGRARRRAVAVYGAMAAGGFVVGMLLGGLITALWGWRWVFLGVVPVAVLGAAAGLGLPGSGVRHGKAPRPRVRVSAAVVVGLTLLMAGLSGAVPGGPPVAIVLAVLGAAAVVVVVRRDGGRPDALLPWPVVRTRVVALPNLALALQAMVGIAWLYLLTTTFQRLRGAGPIEAGLLFTPMTLAAMLGALTAARVVGHLGAGRAAAGGQAAVLTGILVMLWGVPTDRPTALLIVGSVIGEAGFMVSNVGLTVAATSGMPVEHSGLGAALINSAAQIGGGVGLAITGGTVAALLAAGVSGSVAVQAGMAVCAGFAVGAGGVAIAVARGEHRPAGDQTVVSKPIRGS